MKLPIFLAGASAAIAASIAPAVVDSSAMLSIMGPGDLDEQNFSVFTECVQALNSSYRAYADEGVLVIIPPNNRTIDLNTTDEELWKCIQSSSSTISLAIESSEFYEQAHETITDVRTIQHSTAVEMGVKGQIVVDRVPSHAKTSALEARDMGYFYVHHSEESTCKGDFGYYFIAKCYNYSLSYRSTSAGNLDSSRWLNYSIWPHHNCIKGDYRTIAIAPNTQCTCQVRATFSFHAYYQ